MGKWEDRGGTANGLNFFMICPISHAALCTRSNNNAIAIHISTYSVYYDYVHCSLCDKIKIFKVYVLSRFSCLKKPRDLIKFVCNMMRECGDKEKF